jgi:fatty-acid desaturase
MNARRISAVLLAIFIILFPFRRAFLSHEEPGIMMIASFILTVIGIVIFYALTASPKSHQ